LTGGLIRGRLDHSNQFEHSNSLANHNEVALAGAGGHFYTNTELNSGEHGQIRRGPGAPGSSYFDNTQDEATGGEGYFNANSAFEEEKIAFHPRSLIDAQNTNWNNHMEHHIYKPIASINNQSFSEQTLVNQNNN
jgi:hypothetical protein